MINQLAENLLRTQNILEQNDSASVRPGLEQKMTSPKDGTKEDKHVPSLYAMLTDAWAADPEMSSAEIISRLRNFTTDDQSIPYKNSKTHVEVLALLMNRMKQDGQDALPIYARLNTALGMAVVSNGILDAFVAQMLKHPEDLDTW